MRKNLHHKIMLSILAGSLALGFVYAPPAFSEDVTIEHGANDGNGGAYKLDADRRSGTNYGDNYITLPTGDIGTFTVTAGNGGNPVKNDSLPLDGGSISLSKIENAINGAVIIRAGNGGYSGTTDSHSTFNGGNGGDVTLNFNDTVKGDITATGGNGGNADFSNNTHTFNGGNGGDVTLNFNNTVKGDITATGGNGSDVSGHFIKVNWFREGNGGDVTLIFNETVKGDITATGGNGGKYAITDVYSTYGQADIKFNGSDGGDVTLTFNRAVTGDINAKGGSSSDSTICDPTYGGNTYFNALGDDNGSNGGNVTLTFNETVTGNINATGGNSGNFEIEGNPYFRDANGGNVTLTFKNVVADTITATGGNGGDVNTPNYYGANNGGNGGDATLTFENVVANSITLTSGSNGDNKRDTAFKGGSVTFTANSISGNTTTGDIDIELSKNDGDITFDVGTLNIADNTVKITVEDNSSNSNNNGENNIVIAKTGQNHIDNLILTGNGDFKTIDANRNQINDITVGSLTIDGAVISDNTENNKNNNWDNIIGRTYTTDNDNIALGENGVTFDITSDKTLAKNLTGSSTGNLTKTGAGTLALTGSTYDYTGLTVVEQGTLDASNYALASSKGLTLFGGATFIANTDQDWDGNQLAVYDNGSDNSAIYQGDLSALNSNLYFIANGNNTNPLLSVTGSADISNSKFDIGFTGKTVFDEGETLTLIEADGTIDASGLQKGDGFDNIDIGSTIAQPITDVTTIPDTESKLVATLGEALATDEASAINGGTLGTLAFNLQGADLIAREGMEAAVRSAQLDNNHAVFAALTRSSLDYGTIDVDATNMLAGLAWRSTTGAGSLTYGVFAEHGDGSYDTYANINGTSLHGEGDTDYTGGGILARMDFNVSENGHGYLEASGRVGNADTDYTNSGLRDAYGRAASYSTDGTYYGAHIGAGYVQKLDEKSSIDWYGKLLWARLEGGSADLSTGEHLTFDDADSLRLRIDGRWNYAASDFVSYYAGLGYEYEFDGEASGFTNGLALGDEDLTGGSGVAELGISFKPSKNSPFSLELNLAGFTGEREGFRGGVEAVYTF